jgi:hypothetical protein
MKSGVGNVIFPMIETRFRFFERNDFRDAVLKIKFQTDADILVIDPLASFADVDEKKSLDIISDVCDEAGMAVIITHSQRNPTLEDWASSTVVLDWERNRYVKTMCIKSRNFQPFERFYLKINENLIFNREEPFEEFNYNRIADIVRENGGTFSTKAEFITAVRSKLGQSIRKATALIEIAVERRIVIEEILETNTKQYRLP